MSKPTGPNQQDQAGDKKSGQGGKPGHGEAPGQHTGGLLNQQDEPQSAEDAKKRAAEKAHGSK